MKNRLLVAAVLAGGVGLVAIDLPALGRADAGSLVRVGVLAAFLAASKTWPALMYRRDQSEALALDEGVLVILVLTSSAALTVLAFAVATAAAQLARRRPLAKSLFNFGMAVVAAAAAAEVTAWLSPADGAASPWILGAAIAGAGTFWAVNTVLLAGLLSSLGSSFWWSVVDGVRVRALLWASCVAVGLPVGLALGAHDWLLPFTVGPFLALRQVLAGHFQARHDHSRVVGLLESALEVNGTMQPGEVRSSLLSSARALLRCGDATLGNTPPGVDELGERIHDGEAGWLVVSRRSRAEPFDDTDRRLLATLAAVGSTALRNAGLYEEAGVQREQLSILTASLGEAVVSVNRTGVVTFLNPAATLMLGDVLVGASAPHALALAASQAMDRRRTIRDDDMAVPGRHTASLPVGLTASPVLRGAAVTGAVLVLRDSTERKAFEQELARHAFEDPLTGLPNRRLFLDHINLALRRSERSGEVHAVLFVDVDRFKTVNDSLGHHVGDQLLVAIANRMCGFLRPGDTLARLGGDEFVVLLENVAGPDEVQVFAALLTSGFDEPVTVGSGREVFVSASIGIALSSAGQSAEDLLSDADVAMYQAKRRGTGRHEFYDTYAMRRRSAERLDLEVATRRGIDRSEFETYFQPLVRTDDGSIVGAEALVRWRHPQRGLILPEDFIDVAEDTGLILPIGDTVLEEACRQACRWADGGHPIGVSVNLSGRQFTQPDLVERVAAVLAGTGLPPDRLTLEIVENLALEDVVRTSAVILSLKQLGVHFAIDDFGTGYSSLSYLKSFPVDEVKIDRSFVAGLGVSDVDTVIVRCVTELAAALGIGCVAEGVETDIQLRYLRDLDCPSVQGFLFSPALPAEEFAVLIDDGRRWPGRLRRGDVA